MRRPSGALITVFAALLAGAATFATFGGQYQSESRAIAEQNLAALDVAYRSTVEMYRLGLETRMRLQILTPEATAILAAAAHERDAGRRAVLRGRLYRELLPAYRDLRADGLSQLQFHLPGGVVFLRFQAPDRYGDDLGDLRPSVRIVDEEMRAVSGFETGRSGPGFRNVYPILRDGENVGSVEISLTFADLRRGLDRLFSCRGCALMVPERTMDVVVSEESLAVFETSRLDGRYRRSHMSSVETSGGPHGHLVDPVASGELDAVLARDGDVPRLLDAGESFVRPLFHRGRAWIAALLALRDPLGRPVAYVVAYTEAPVLLEVRRAVTLRAVGAAGLILFAAAAVLALLSNRRRLAAERQQLDLITRNMADGLFLVDHEGCALFINEAASRLLGWRSEDLIGRRIHDLVHSHGSNRFLPYEECPLYASTMAAEPYDGEELFRDRSGGLHPVEVNTRPLVAGGEVLGSVTVFRDITARKETEERTRLAARVFEHTHEGILVTDAERRIVEVNDAFCRITGFDRAEVLGRTPRVLSSGLQSATFYDAMWREIGTAGFWRGELWNRRKDGTVFAERLTVTAVKSPTGDVSHYVGVFSDITAIKHHERELLRIAHFDSLTGVPNRILLAERMEEALADARRQGRILAICYVDIDGFKEVNDTHGHEVGDALLVAIVGRFDDGLRAEDTLARLGGDEFILVLHDVHPGAELDGAMARVLERASRPFHIDGLVVEVSASVGVTLFPYDDVDADTLLRHADRAMYEAKQAGRNRWHLFDRDTERREQNRIAEAARIAEALERREFVLHYQPQVDMRSGRVVGLEALIRWNHPERGLLTPDVFLPTIENTALVVSIGEWVIDAALTRMSEWRAEGFEIAVGVNVAARQIQDPAFVERLRALLDAHPDVDPGRLELEVLETAALEDLAQVSATIAVCRDLGVRFALDDFGTGYSSLTYIKRLPADTLKIDRSFVSAMPSDPEDLSIVEGVIGMAKSFHREVVAEGVETVAHGTLLLKLGCRLAQGFGIARPMPGDRVAAWSREWVAPPEWAAVAARAWDESDRPLIVAEVEMRHAIEALGDFVAGGRDRPPDAADCLNRFLDWYRGVDPERSPRLAAFHRIEAIRDRFEGLAERIVHRAQAGDAHGASVDLPALQVLEAELIGCLHGLLTHAERAA